MFSQILEKRYLDNEFLMKRFWVFSREDIPESEMALTFNENKNIHRKTNVFMWCFIHLNHDLGVSIVSGFVLDTANSDDQT